MLTKLLLSPLGLYCSENKILCWSFLRQTALFSFPPEQGVCTWRCRWLVCCPADSFGDVHCPLPGPLSSSGREQMQRGETRQISLTFPQILTHLWLVSGLETCETRWIFCIWCLLTDYPTVVFVQSPLLFINIKSNCAFRWLYWNKAICCSVR